MNQRRQHEYYQHLRQETTEAQHSKKAEFLRRLFFLVLVCSHRALTIGFELGLKVRQGPE